MGAAQFSTFEKMNGVLCPKHPFTDAKAERIFNDPYYGLNNPDNYYHWNAFLYTTTDTERIAWKWEMKTYFDMTLQQVAEIEENWNTMYADALTTVYESIPSPDEYLNEVGVAYWQWADGYMTNRRSLPYEPSVTKIVNTVTGYPEISYFISDYLLQTSVSGVSAKNIEAMKDVKLYNDTAGPSDLEPPTDNYEYLFTLKNSSGGDPDPHSLFNVQTLMKLCELGENVTNIITEPDKTYDVDFNLSADGNWTSLADTLGLSVRQTYVIWLWMDTAYNLTFARTADKGDTQIGIIGTLGASAFNVTMNQMQLEVPMFTIAEELTQTINTTYKLSEQNANETKLSINSTQCEEVYTKQFMLTQNQSISLCTNSSFFNFSDVFNSSVAFVNTYLYSSVYNPKYYNDFMAALGLNTTDPTD